jgi:hypothetical protein
LLINGFNIADRPFITRVIRLYSLILNRAPDPDGLQTYVQSLKKGRSLEDMAAIFFDSDEFRQRHGDAEHFGQTLQALLPGSEALRGTALVAGIHGGRKSTRPFPPRPCGRSRPCGLSSPRDR